MDGRALYDEDVYAWAQAQAQALRRLAETRRDLSNELDLINIAEEIQDVGESELHRAESLLTQTLIHLLKAYADPASRARGHWIGEAVRLQFDARRAFSPSMRRLMELDGLWRGAVRIAAAKLYAFGVESIPPLPDSVPFTSDEILADDFDPEPLLPRLGPRE